MSISFFGAAAALLVVYTTPSRAIEETRELQQSDSSDSVQFYTIATTSEELNSAIARGDTHIELRNHLDIRSWVSPVQVPNDIGSGLLATTRSFRV